LGVCWVEVVFFVFVTTNVKVNGFSVSQSDLQGVQQLVKLVGGQVEDGFISEDFDVFVFLDGNALASFATLGVLVRGNVLDRFS
jgi:hypothetical protein